MKVLIADDHALIREGMSHALSQLRPDAVMVNAQDYTEALQRVSAETDFDLVLLDLTMPGMDGLEGLVCLQQQLGDVPVVVISATDSPDTVKRVLAAGARGYIPKISPQNVLLMALELVLCGGTYIPPELLDCSDIAASDPTAATTPTDVNISMLTRRQKEVTQLLAQGKTNKQISRELGLSEGTVRTHLNAIYKTLNVSNRTQAGRVAHELGLLDTSL